MKLFGWLFRRRRTCWAMIVVAVATWQSQAGAAVRLPRIISDHMVLQCDHRAPIWGWADPHERVTVEIAGQTAGAIADVAGRWLVCLEPLPASREPLEMTVRGADNGALTVRDILIGELWLGSGQSNMVMELPADRRQSPPATIRVFKVAQTHAVEPSEEIEGQWFVATPDSLASFSWVLYVFGRELHDDLQVPVGLVQSTWGGTPIQAWMPAAAFAGEPLLADDLKIIDSARADFDQAKRDFAAGRDVTAKESAAEGAAPAEPQHPFSHPGDWPGYPTVLYNAMIHPLAPYRIRGFLWYQGETNVFDKRPEIYGIRMKAMISAWRNRWGQEGLPLYFVQLPPFHYKTTNDPYSLTKLWQGQLDSLDIVSSTEIVPTMDLGEINDIHPARKDEVGKRLARIALHQTYGHKKLAFRGPRYDAHGMEGGSMRVRFRDVGSGLTSRDGRPLTWFQIAGEDGTFVDAQAVVAGSDVVVVSSPKVATPIAVRFGWSNVAQPNLANHEGLPALPFSTERW